MKLMKRLDPRSTFANEYLQNGRSKVVLDIPLQCSSQCPPTWASRNDSTGHVSHICRLGLTGVARPYGPYRVAVQNLVPNIAPTRAHAMSIVEKVTDTCHSMVHEPYPTGSTL
ncbi:hypothetical protein CRG98_032097 [Punica granatum]|uniref:Uncharacterized protein n=1 Tax=Punica granatum TaxID=22663 RepID=A0A2I0IU27_PUNGR|nr:hypothetical protein CRG98_032097 [Punica granatum]